MQPNLNAAVASARSEDFRRFAAERQPLAGTVRQHRSRLGVLAAFRRYFDHAVEADKQPPRGPGERAGGTRARDSRGGRPAYDTFRAAA